MARIVRSASTLRTVPNSVEHEHAHDTQTDLSGLPGIPADEGSDRANMEFADDLPEAAGQTSVPVASAAPQTRRRGRPPREQLAAGQPPVIAPPIAAPAALPTAAALQGLGMLYLFARGSGSEIGEVVESLREALAAYDALGPQTPP